MQVELKPRDAVSCKNCGHRILYKERTSRGMCADADDDDDEVCS
jgi:DNA-directed RNA polymerase subunit RPC12/RpoP